MTGIMTSNHYEVFLSFLVQSPWTAQSPELDPLRYFWTSTICDQTTLLLGLQNFAPSDLPCLL
jgi:hypothetical protein